MELYSYSSAIFNRTLTTIDEHKKECELDSVGRSMKQALMWWDRLPEFAKQNLRDHTFLQRETFNMVYDFYWGE